MKKTCVRLTAAVIASVILLGATNWTYANFADNWLEQSNSTQPGHFKGGQRGYFTAGSFSGRWPVSNDHLLSVTKPRLKSGCGGIDMFLGGFSFLNSDYLVQKLQRILAAAPAAAFDIALKTLAPQVSDTIKSLEAIVDKLNNLQLDDCKAGQTLVSVASSPFSATAVEGTQANAMSALSDFSQSSGATDLYNKFMTTVKGEQSGGASPTAKAATSAALQGCPPALQSLFAGGSLMNSIGYLKGLPSDITDNIRSFIGDVIIYTPADDMSILKAQYIPPCDRNSFEDVVNGTSEIRTYSGNAIGGCAPTDGVNADLVNYVSKRLLSLANDYKTKTAISSDDANFLASLPLPVWPALRSSVKSGTEAEMMTKLSNVAAKGLAYGMMMDMFVRVYQLSQYAAHIQSSAAGADDGKPTETCQLALIHEPQELASTLEVNARAKLQEAQQSYQTAATELNSMEQMVANLERFNDLVNREITTRFGRGVALRATSR